ncbi:MAG: hypothetical protein CMN30_02835 [Sandaracinus sp.]|nr:hypothetical protein [Sandaracinus sp.]
MTGFALRRSALIFIVSALVACDPGSDDRTGSGDGDRTGVDAGTSTGGQDFGPPQDYGLGECAATRVDAETALAPVDIVWVVDNSGSMSEEAELVQANLNDFAATITAAGIDVHVVLITAPGFVDVPPPLGDDASQFLRIDEDVQSSNSFDKLLYTFPQYSSFLRRTSSLHFVVVTDDESGMSASDFHTQMLTNLGRTFRLHAIASPPGSSHAFGGFTMPGCDGPNGEAADNGDIYWEEASRTGGLALSICAADWSVLFDNLTAQIAIPMALPCAYGIPEPPEGEEFAPNRVNVEYTPGSGGGSEIIPYVADLDGCTGEGWYYDDLEDPNQVLVCPLTCRRLEEDASGSVEVAFGCATVIR